MAQLVAHHTGSVGVRGSSPLGSTQAKALVRDLVSRQGFCHSSISRAALCRIRARSRADLASCLFDQGVQRGGDGMIAVTDRVADPALARLDRAEARGQPITADPG